MSKSTDSRQGALLDFEAEKGRTFYRILHCQFYDSGHTLQDFQWTNYSGATMSVKRTSKGSVIELHFTTDDGTLVLDNDGRLTFNQTAEVMDTIRAGDYQYDLYILGTDPNYAERDFLYGKFTVASKITL